MLDSRLTEILVCPVCKGPLRMNEAKTELHCAKCALAYRIVDDIAVMLASEARAMTRKEQETARVRPAKE